MTAFIKFGIPLMVYKFLVTLFNDVRNGFAYNYMATSKRRSTHFLNAISKVVIGSYII